MCAVQKPKAYIDRPEEAGKLRALLTSPATGFFYFCTGPPGGGKTTLIQRVCNEVNLHYDADVMLAPYYLWEQERPALCCSMPQESVWHSGYVTYCQLIEGCGLLCSWEKAWCMWRQAAALPTLASWPMRCR